MSIGVIVFSLLFIFPSMAVLADIRVGDQDSNPTIESEVNVQASSNELTIKQTNDNGLIIIDGPVDVMIGEHSEISGILVNKGSLSEHINHQTGDGADSALGSVSIE